MKQRIAFLSFIFLLPAIALGQSVSEWQKSQLQWREERVHKLQAPDGWFSVVGLDWLVAKDTSFGSAPDNHIHLGGSSDAHLGIFHLENGSVHLLPPASGFPAGLRVNGQPAQTQILAADDSKNPTKLTDGTLTMFLIRRGDRIGLRTKDSQAPARLNFHGLHWYAPNPAYVIHARWIPYPQPKTEQVPTILGTTTPMQAPGIAEFSLNGQTYRLEPVLEDPADTSLFFIVRDTTSSTKTYGAGRFVYTSFPDHGLKNPGELLIDLNKLVNPPCAYIPYATCPLPPKQNRLQVALPVGEQRYHD